MSGLLSRAFARQGAAAGVPSYGMIPPLGSVQTASGLLVSQATAMTVPAIYACIRVLSNDVARCKPTLFRRTPDGARAVVEPKEHPVAAILRKPNRVQTWFEFVRDWIAGYLLRGNGYAAKLTDRRGDIREMILVNPDAVFVLEATDGEWFYNVNRIGLFQIAMLRDFPVAIPAEDIMHLRGMSFNMLVGASTIGLARDAIGLAMGLSQQQSRFVGNGARPSFVLETDRKLTDDIARRLKETWDQANAGIMNTGGTVVLEEGLKAKALQLTAVDLQLIDQYNLTVQDAGRIYGLPPRKLGLPDLSRGANAVQDEQQYINTAVAPLLEMIEQKFDREFGLAEEGLELDLDSDSLLRADPATRYNLGRIGILSGMITRNEWRRPERLPPMAGGDVLMNPVNLAALGSDIGGTAPDAAGRPEAGQEPDFAVPNAELDNAVEAAAVIEFKRRLAQRDALLQSLLIENAHLREAA